jgi:hypothetical protein
MNIRRLLLVSSALWLASLPVFSQQLDPNFRGVWKLNVEKSDFGGNPKPKMGQVNWTEHGWVYAVVTDDGHLYADAALTDHGGCILIGVQKEFSCEVKVIAPKHVRLVLKQGSAVRRVGDIELPDKNTTQTTHRVTPGDGQPYVEKTIWERDSE